MSEWMMVEVASRDEQGFSRIKGPKSNKGSFRIAPAYLHPLPPAFTPEERAVVEAAVRCPKEAMDEDWTIIDGSALDTFLHATRALIASRTPPDPLADLVAAVTECLAWQNIGGPNGATARLASALSAARAAVAK